ncbi:MAG: response regulator transcription factor [Bifidobacteriaceae bacterium]|jgi:DNA-binding response OmpR family regulator|nr:response regulator transcription factor [Bifidobacteriaceae bacterium]
MGVLDEPVQPGCAGPRAVVVEDEPALAALVARYLEKDGFTVWRAATGPDGLAAVRQHDPAVIVLDLSLPGLDGIEVARQLRTFSDAYLVMLTARAEEVDKLIGLAVGGDDYMTKPFSPRELIARVRALLRRPRQLAHGTTAWPDDAAGLAPAHQVGLATGPGAVRDPDGTHELVFGDLAIDPAAREVTVAGRVVELTRTEFDLLAALAAGPRQVFTREALLRALWGPSWVGDAHAVDVHLGNLRRKLGDNAKRQRYIRTVRGVGYRIGTGQ